MANQKVVVVWALAAIILALVLVLLFYPKEKAEAQFLFLGKPAPFSQEKENKAVDIVYEQLKGEIPGFTKEAARKNFVQKVRIDTINVLEYYSRLDGVCQAIASDDDCQQILQDVIARRKQRIPSGYECHKHMGGAETQPWTDWILSFTPLSPGEGWHCERYVDEHCHQPRKVWQILQQMARNDCSGLKGTWLELCNGIQQGCASMSTDMLRRVCNAFASHDPSMCPPETNDVAIIEVREQLGDVAEPWGCGTIVALYESFRTGKDQCGTLPGYQEVYCRSLYTKNCNLLGIMIDEYTYTSLGYSMKNPKFCELVDEPQLRESCKTDEDPQGKDFIVKQ